MPDPAHTTSDRDSIDKAAATWLLRVERGLSLDEEIQLAEWLAADPRHCASFEEFRRGWERFQPLAVARPDAILNPGCASLPESVSPSAVRTFAGANSSTRRIWVRVLISSLGTAAALMVGIHFATKVRAPDSSAITALTAIAAKPQIDLLARCEERTLEDGSVIELNRGAVLDAQLSNIERHVWLRQGEANFKVAKDPNRPFIVSVAGVEVRAVGTQFNVRFDASEVEVVVAEGKVHVMPSVAPSGVALAGSPDASRHVPVAAGQRAIVPLASSFAPGVTTMTAREIEARLAWQPKLLDFDDAPLSGIVAEFNRRNPVHLVVSDSAIAAMRMTISFRSDNLEGFIRLLEASYGIRAEQRGETEFVLGR